MDRIINTRLIWHLEKKSLLLPQQAGFRKHMSTEDQVAHIAQGIKDAFQEGRHTVAVWVDMEKAFDKVWHDGMRLKMLKAGVCGKMFHWISHLLANRTARVQLRGHTSRKAQIQQGGVLSPTLFVIYINDVTEDIRRSVHSSLYAALWTSDKHISSASAQLQNALRILESWLSKWLLKINEEKTTYTSFTLSNKKQVAKLLLNGKALREDETPHI
jgi:hypothetical protein